MLAAGRGYENRGANRNESTGTGVEEGEEGKIWVSATPVFVGCFLFMFVH